MKTNYDTLHNTALKFLKHYKPLSKMVGGISVTMREELIEMFCLENDMSDKKHVNKMIMLIKEMIDDDSNLKRML